MNIVKIEALLVVRNSQGEIITIFNKKEGTNLFEICSVSTIGMEELTNIISGKVEVKV